VLRDDGNARKLPDASRQGCVGEETHTERGEHRPATGPGRRDRLLDDDVPGVRADGDREEVDEHRDCDPFPFDRPERTLEQSGIGPAPDGEGYQAGDGDEDDEKTDETRFGDVEPFHAAALTASDGAATRS
jgi:hypothetical protein